MTAVTVNCLYVVAGCQELGFCRPPDTNTSHPEAMNVSCRPYTPGNGWHVNIWKPIKGHNCVATITWLACIIADRQQTVILDIIVEYAYNIVMHQLKCQAYTIGRPGRMGSTAFDRK